MTRLSTAALLMLPLLLLAGCDKPAKNDQRSATGEVLKGTISDDMLPLDKLKSQGPMISPSERASASDGEADDTGGPEDATSAASGEPEAETTPAPTSAPSAAP